MGTLALSLVVIGITATVTEFVRMRRRIAEERERARWIEGCLRSSLAETIKEVGKLKEGNGLRDAARAKAAADAEAAALKEDRDYWEQRARTLEARQQ